MKKQLIITIFVIAFALSALSIWSMTHSFRSQEFSYRNKSNLTCSAQGDIRPPAWDKEEDKTINGS